MASTALDIYNQALSACNAKGRLASLTDNTRARHECDIWYDDVLRTVQMAAFWPSCRALEALTLDTTRNFGVDWVSTDPQPEYKYKYSLPANYLRAWHLTNYDRFSIHYDVTNDSLYLSTNTEDAVLVYAYKQTDVSLWEVGQSMATAYGVAGHVAGALTGRGELVQKNITLANQYLIDAQAASYNDDENQLTTLPPPLVARGYGGLTNTPRFLYPYGSLFTAAITNV